MTRPWRAPLRADYQYPAFAAPTVLEAGFERRLEAANFTLSNLKELLCRIDVERARADSAQLRYMRAMLLLQCAPDMNAVSEAEQLLVGSAVAGAARAREIAGLMRHNSRNNTRSFRPARINWSVNNACPMACLGCYNPFGESDADAELVESVLEQMQVAGIRNIMLSGGDPLLWPLLPYTLERCSALGIRVGLDTTGVALGKWLRDPDFAQAVTTLGLPLDGHDEATQAAFRKSREPQLHRLLAETAADAVVRGMHVRIHTVVSRSNVHALDKIGSVVRKIRPAQWTLYQWWPRRASTKLIGELSVSQPEFESAVSAARASCPDIDVHAYAAGAREFMNFFVQSNGQVLVFGRGVAEEFIIGDLRQDSILDVLRSPGLCQAAVTTKLVV